MQEGREEGRLHQDVALLRQLDADRAGLVALVGFCPLDALRDGQSSRWMERLQVQRKGLGIIRKLKQGDVEICLQELIHLPRKWCSRLGVEGHQCLQEC